jgi:hypothetical protein
MIEAFFVLLVVVATALAFKTRQDVRVAVRTPGGGVRIGIAAVPLVLAASPWLLGVHPIAVFVVDAGVACLTCLAVITCYALPEARWRQPYSRGQTCPSFSDFLFSYS